MNLYKHELLRRHQSDPLMKNPSQILFHLASAVWINHHPIDVSQNLALSSYSKFP